MDPSGQVAWSARAGAVVRSNAYLAAEAGLVASERLARSTGDAWGLWSSAMASLPRALTLGTLAADVYQGYADLRARATWAGGVGAWEWDLEHRRGAARVRGLAAALGGLLIKAGQFASARPDLLPAAYVEALASLQDRVPPHPWPTMARAVERELGRPLDAVFAGLDPTPVASASLAQVHRGHLRHPAADSAVAVKIQYPEVREVVNADLQALACMFDTLAVLEPGLRLQPILDHLRATAPLELDFAREARAAGELRSALAHRADVLVPDVVPGLGTQRLLVTRFVEGIKITDRAGLVAAGIDASAVAWTLNDMYAEQMLRLGHLHADPHPGNLLVQPGPRLVLLDHGLTVRLADDTIAGLRGMLRALVAGDLVGLRAALTEAGVDLGPADQGGHELSSLLSLAGVLSGGGAVRSARLGRELIRPIGGIPPELITVGRALGLLDGITRQLDPDLDVLGIVGRYA